MSLELLDTFQPECIVFTLRTNGHYSQITILHVIRITSSDSLPFALFVAVSLSVGINSYCRIRWAFVPSRCFRNARRKLESASTYASQVLKGRSTLSVAIAVDFLNCGVIASPIMSENVYICGNEVPICR
jgi:uncharacterized membrane protein